MNEKELDLKLEKQVIELVNIGNMSEAITVVMKALDYGLREAKQIVDQYR